VRPDYARLVIHDSSKLAFFIHIRFANNVNKNIFVELHSSFNIRVNWCQFASDFFYEKKANHHESRIVWSHPKDSWRSVTYQQSWFATCDISREVMRYPVYFNEFHKTVSVISDKQHIRYCILFVFLKKNAANMIFSALGKDIVTWNL